MYRSVWPASPCERGPATSAYVAVPATARAVLAGSVHGVVVHARKYTCRASSAGTKPRSTSSLMTAGNFGKIDGSMTSSRYPSETSCDAKVVLLDGLCQVVL